MVVLPPPTLTFFELRRRLVRDIVFIVLAAIFYSSLVGSLVFLVLGYFLVGPDPLVVPIVVAEAFVDVTFWKALITTPVARRWPCSPQHLGRWRRPYWVRSIEGLNWRWLLGILAAAARAIVASQ